MGMGMDQKIKGEILSHAGVSKEIIMRPESLRSCRLTCEC
jgi:hypothetical protein